MVEKIVDILNEHLADIDKSQAIYGIGQSVIRVTGTISETMPGLIEKNGEAKYIGIDDVKSLIVYHKQVGFSSTQQNNGRGDNPGDLVNTFTHNLLLYWDRKRINKLPDQMLMLLQSRWPILITGVEDTKIVRVTIASANINSLQVYNQEYVLEKPKLPANIHLMSVTYSIQITLNPACLSACL